MNRQKICSYLSSHRRPIKSTDGRRLPKGPKRDIVDETFIWTHDGYEIYEVLSCGHVQPLQADDDGMPNATYRMCKACLKDWRSISFTIPSFEELRTRKMDWYEEKIAIYQAPTMYPYTNYSIGEGPEGSRLSKMRSVYELLHFC